MRVVALAIVGVLAFGGDADAAVCRAAKSRVLDARLDHGRVIACFEGRARACYALDLTQLAWARVPTVAIESTEGCGDTACGATAPHDGVPNSAVVTACAADGTACHTVTTPLAFGLGVVTDGALIAAIEEQRITVADARSGSVATTIAPWEHPTRSIVWRFHGVRFVGPDRLFVELGDGSDNFARVFDAKTGAVALALPGELEFDPLVVFGDELALASKGGREIMFGDVKHATRRSIPLFSNARGLALFAGTANSIVAVQQGDDGTVAISDGHAVKLVAGPAVCP